MTVAWGIFEIEEESFDLGHLDETVISVEIGGEQHAILVEFSDHCFTEEALPDDARPKFPSSTRKDGRFCVKLTTEEGEDPLHYVIPFTLERWKGDKRAKLKMRVRSAFLRDSSRRVATFGQVKFATLVELTLTSASPRRNYDRNRKKPW